MKKTILFRADGNTNSGLGHLYRLISLVEMVKSDYDYVFVTRSDSTLSVFDKTIVTSLIPNEISTEKEVDWLKGNFSPSEHIIIADGYQFISSYQKAAKEAGFSVVYIDDLAKEDMFADVVINHSPGLTPKNYKLQPYTKLFLGTDYALLRPTFLRLSEDYRNVTRIDTVFICFGGADPYNLTLKALKACLQVHTIEVVNIVLGGAYSYDTDAISNLETNKRVHIHRNLSEVEMAKVMLSSNLAIVPSSTILYELCCIKMPILSGYFVDNQERIYHGFLERKAIFGMGNIINFTERKFGNAVIEIMKDDALKEQLMFQSKLFDGRIKKRYLQLIEELC